MNFDFTLTANEGYTYQPFTDGHAVGYYITAPNGNREVLFLNPFDATDNGRAVISVHHGNVDDVDLADVADGVHLTTATAVSYVDLFDTGATAHALALVDLTTMSIGAEPTPPEVHFRKLEHFDRLDGLYDVGEVLNFGRIAAWLNLYGVKAHVEQAGGNIALICVGERTDYRYQAIIGSGCIDRIAYPDGQGTAGHLTVGPDDQDAPAELRHKVPTHTTELECAWMAVHMLAGTQMWQADGRTVAKAKPLGPAITA